MATPVTWREVPVKLDPAAYTVLTVPARVAELKADRWPGFAELAQRLPVRLAEPLVPGRDAAAIVRAAPAQKRR